MWGGGVRKGSQSMSYGICHEETELDPGSRWFHQPLGRAACSFTLWPNTLGHWSQHSACSTMVTPGSMKGMPCHLMDTSSGGSFALRSTQMGLGMHV